MCEDTDTINNPHSIKKHFINKIQVGHKETEASLKVKLLGAKQRGDRPCQDFLKINFTCRTSEMGIDYLLWVRV